MKKIFLAVFVVGFVALISCNPEGILVQWTEANAKWEGRLQPHDDIVGQNQISCCKPGKNCAKREIRDPQPFTTTLRNYLADDDLAGYFQNESWQEELPELVPYPDVVNYVLSNNPKSKIVSNGEGGESYVIFKDRNQPETGTENILFAISTKMRPCDER